MMFRKTYSFTHPKAKAPKIFKAFTKGGAYKKMKSFVISMMFGDWAMVYDKDAVDRVMSEVNCEEIKKC